MDDPVLVDVADGILTLTLNRVEKKNALTGAMYERLTQALNTANSDRAIRVVLIQANGDLFTGGNDIAEFAAFAADQGGEMAAEAFVRALIAFEKPLVAAARGHGVGIGLTLLLHCDLVYVAQEARFSCPFANLAVVPEAASSLLLPSLIGHVRAFELFILGESLTGQMMADWGLANAVLPAGEVQGRALAAARAIAAKPPSAVGRTKALMRNRDLLDRCATEEFAQFRQQLLSPEAREAFAAFLEKRPADFSGL